MAEQVTAPSISMALDMKKNRIRIHKPTIHMLGDPTLIQLLFDPDAMVVAIICPESEVPGGQEIRVKARMNLQQALFNLQATIDELLQAIKE